MHTDIRDISEVHRPWSFFKAFFEDKEGEKILLMDLFEKYKYVVGEPGMSHKTFNFDLKEWAVESGFELVFKNQRQYRKVILIK